MSETAAQVVRRVRLARPRDLEHLPEIERRSQTLFEPYGVADLYARYLLPASVLRTALSARRLFVATESLGAPVGFALVTQIEGRAQLAEVDVLPERARQGHGTELVRTCLAWAQRRGFREMILSTMRSPPWNAPFYRRFGFRELPASEFTPAIRRLRAAEARRGFPMGERIIMRAILEP